MIPSGSGPTEFGAGTTLMLEERAERRHGPTGAAKDNANAQGKHAAEVNAERKTNEHAQDQESTLHFFLGDSPRPNISANV